jgi:hypothetical protein
VLSDVLQIRVVGACSDIDLESVQSSNLEKRCCPGSCDIHTDRYGYAIFIRGMTQYTRIVINAEI